MLATVTFTSDPNQSGWQFVNLSSPVAVAPNTEYVVSYRTSNNYVATGSYFTPANEVTFDGIDNDAFTDPFGVVSAPQSLVVSGAGIGGNGVYAYGAAILLPTNTFSAANYWVDALIFVSVYRLHVKYLLSPPMAVYISLDLPCGEHSASRRRGRNRRDCPYLFARWRRRSIEVQHRSGNWQLYIRVARFRPPGYGGVGNDLYQVIGRFPDGALLIIRDRARAPRRQAAVTASLMANPLLLDDIFGTTDNSIFAGAA